MNKFELATELDFVYINQLLQRVSLPCADAAYAEKAYFKAVSGDNKLAGCVGLEIYGRYGLLRSLAVDPAFRNQGIATQLINRVVQYALDRSISTLYLLTTTADRYFQRMGFDLTSRNDVPKELRQSSEFADICPVSAKVLKRDIEEDK